MADKKGATRFNAATRQERVFEMLRVRATKAQIIEQLKSEGYTGASSRTYDRDIAALKKRTEAWVDSFATDGLLDEYQHAIESMKERVRRLIAADKVATKPHDIAEINLAIVQVELQILDILEQGPTMWALKRRAQKAEKARTDAGLSTNHTISDAVK